MAVKSASRSPSIRSLTDQDRRWESVFQHLERGEYEHAISDLRKLAETKSHADQPYLESLIKTANQLCLACIHFRKEVDWYENAQSEAESREGELLQQLLIILRLIDGIINPKSRIGEEQTAKYSKETASIWERLQKLLGFNTHLETLDRTAFESFDIDTSGNKSSFDIPPIAGEQLPIVPLSDLERAIEPEKEKEDIYSIQREQSKKPKTPNLVIESGSNPEPPSIVVYCLGPFRVYQDEQQVTDWLSSKGKLIFKYLITHREHPVPKEILMELFWPNTMPDAARNNLNVAIYGLRQALSKSRPDYSHVLFQNDEYALNPGIKIWVDVEEFESYLSEARYLEANKIPSQSFDRLKKAINLYKGDLLEEDIYNEWTVMSRERLRLAYLDALNQLSQIYFSRGEYSEAADLCQLILDRDNCREDAHRRLMRCYYRLSKRSLALRQFQLCKEALKRELEVDPEPATIRLVELIRSQKTV